MFSGWIGWHSLSASPPSCQSQWSALLSCCFFLPRGQSILLLSRFILIPPYCFPGNCKTQKVGLVASLMVTTIAYGMGVGAVPYTMVGEVFTPEHRTLGSCLAQVVRWVYPTSAGSLVHDFSSQERHRLCPCQSDPPCDPASWSPFHLLLPWRCLCSCSNLCLEVCPRNPRKNPLTALLHLWGKKDSILVNLKNKHLNFQYIFVLKG